MSIATNTIRIGKSYRLINHGEIFEFKVEQMIGKSDFKCRDIHTLEHYQYNDLLAFGKGKDYLLDELR